MAFETQSFGIKTLVLQPGSFCTNIAHPDRYNFPPSTAYKETTDWMGKHLAELHGTQQGDPAKFAEVVVDLVEGPGHAQGKKIPTKLGVGSDVCTFRKTWLEGEEKMLEGWEPLVGNTNFGAKSYEARNRDEALPETWKELKK